MEVTKTLAQFVVDSRYADIPEKVRHEAKRSVLNWLGCAVGASRHEGIDIALSALSAFSGPAQASVLGRGERLDIMHAALLNGISSHMFDFDDTHLKTVIHPSGPVASALLALAEYRPMSGADFLHAFILGVEVECRIGNAVYPSHYDVGWHITGTAGVFGAAAAVGRVLGLNVQQMTWALGIAATQSSGLREMFGTMCKSLHGGRAAQNGLSAALLASKGFTSSEQALEAPRGFANVLGESPDLAALTTGLGTVFEVSQNTYKPFPCGVVIHPVIDGCVMLQSMHAVSPPEIRRVMLRVHPLVLELCGRKTPATTLEAKLSVYHSAAAALIRGRMTEQEYEIPCVSDRGVIALRDKVVATADSAIREEEADVVIEFADGKSLHHHVDYAIGSTQRPMSDADIETKFRGLAAPALPATAITQLIENCWNITKAGDAAVLARLAAAPA